MEFDPSAYLDLPVEKPLERRQPLPAGDYVATIANVEARSWQSKDKYDEKTGQLKSGIVFDVQLTIEVPEAVRTSIGLTNPSITLKDSIMIDRNESGGIDDGPGRNARLRLYREALDMNKAGEAFRARGMIGKMLKVRLGHEALPSGDLVERVGAVARLG